MKSLSELQEERNHYVHLLENISIKRHTKYQYDYGRGEVYGDSQEYIEYTDPELANYYKRKIHGLNQIINNYAAYSLSEKNAIEFNKKLNQEAEEKYFEDEAVKLYENAQQEYRSKGLIGKTIALFQGKRPQSSLTNEQVQEVYLPEVKIIEIDKKIEKLISDKEAVIMDIKENPEKFKYPEQLIIYYEDSFNKQIEELQSQKEELSTKRR